MASNQSGGSLQGLAVRLGQAQSSLQFFGTTLVIVTAGLLVGCEPCSREEIIAQRLMLLVVLAVGSTL